MERLTREQFLKKLQDNVKKAGSKSLYARQLGVSRTCLSLALHNHRNPSEDLVNRAGYKTVISYTSLKKEEKNEKK